VPDFQPFVPASQKPPEFTIRAVLLGAIFGIIFGAVTVYVGLRAGLTVAASIPIAVICAKRAKSRFWNASSSRRRATRANRSLRA
jgi:uncharacterized oligopeptide transporter (OPT) family protein